MSVPQERGVSFSKLYRLLVLRRLNAFKVVQEPEVEPFDRSSKSVPRGTHVRANAFIMTTNRCNCGTNETPGRARNYGALVFALDVQVPGKNKREQRARSNLRGSRRNAKIKTVKYN